LYEWSDCSDKTVRFFKKDIGFHFTLLFQKLETKAKPVEKITLESPSAAQHESNRKISTQLSASRKSASRHRSRSKSQPTSRLTRGRDDSSSKHGTGTDPRDGKEQKAEESRRRPTLKRNNFATNRWEPAKADAREQVRSRTPPGDQRRSEREGRRSSKDVPYSSSRRGGDPKSTRDEQSDDRRSTHNSQSVRGREETGSRRSSENLKGGKILDRRPIELGNRKPVGKLSDELPDKKPIDIPITKKFSELSDKKPIDVAIRRKFTEAPDLKPDSRLEQTSSCDPDRKSSGTVSGSKSSGSAIDRRSSERSDPKFRRPSNRETSSENLHITTPVTSEGTSLYPFLLNFFVQEVPGRYGTVPTYRYGCFTSGN